METKVDLKEVLRRVSFETKFDQKVLEKDYHLTKILQAIAGKKIKDLVFKGGTCLNKCYLDFYRLSEDLDFVYNKDISGFSATQVKKILSQLRKEFFEVLDKLRLETDQRLGKGWKMLTSKIPQKFIGLEIITGYSSLIDNTKQTSKIEVSFRKELARPVKEGVIKHKFYDALGEPILPENIKIKVIDLAENFAEKFRALVTRRGIATRDIYDIFYMLKNKSLPINKGLIDLILLKINESEKFTKKELLDFVNALHVEGVEKEIEAVIKTDEKIDVKGMVDLIKKKFSALLQ